MTTHFPTLWRDFDSLFREFGVPMRNIDSQRAWVPAADVRETDKAIELHLDMPGLDPEAIELKLDGNVLTVSAERNESNESKEQGWLRQERSWGRFERSFTLPNTLDGSKPEAVYKHGVLQVTLPKKAEVQPKTFKVKVEA